MEGSFCGIQGWGDQRISTPLNRGDRPFVHHIFRGIDEKTAENLPNLLIYGHHALLIPEYPENYPEYPEKAEYLEYPKKADYPIFRTGFDRFSGYSGYSGLLEYFSGFSGYSGNEVG